MVRSYRHARRSAARSHLGRSFVALSLPQMVFGAAGALLGFIFGVVFLPGFMPVVSLTLGAGGGLYVGSLRKDGRDPFQVVRAQVQGHRPPQWSPRWGTLRPATRIVRWRATVTETVEQPRPPDRPMLELMPPKPTRRERLTRGEN